MRECLPWLERRLHQPENSGLISAVTTSSNRGHSELCPLRRHELRAAVLGGIGWTGGLGLMYVPEATRCSLGSVAIACFESTIGSTLKRHGGHELLQQSPTSIAAAKDWSRSRRQVGGCRLRIALERSSAWQKTACHGQRVRIVWCMAVPWAVGELIDDDLWLGLALR